jgi:hypothetical protein
MHRPAHSFLDIHTIDNTIYETYNEAALHLGLFSNHNEGYHTLLEVVASFYTPAQL